jgi:predicted  nucleic acid-binding Zn-ribbon protein
LPKVSQAHIDIAKWIGIFLTTITLLVGSVVWAEEKFDAVKKEIADATEDRYTKREDFARIEQRIINQEKQIEDMNKKLDKILDSLRKR